MTALRTADITSQRKGPVAICELFGYPLLRAACGTLLSLGAGSGCPLGLHYQYPLFSI